jgi:hypothetical protein
MAAASSVGGVGDESSEEDLEDSEDDITALMGLDLPSRQWTAESYANARAVNQFAMPRDTNILFFSTKVQQDAYFGHLVKKTVFKHQTIDLGYMRSHPIMTDLVDRFEEMGLANFLQHRCDWNETVIRQFYATLEIDMVAGIFRWSTGKRTYFATFAQFAAANQLDYDFITSEQSMNVILENPLDENDYPLYYEPAHLGIARTFGGTQGLRHHPAVINKIARVTFMPKSGNKDKVRGLYWNVISHIMNGNRIDVIALIMDQLADLRLNMEMNLYFAPYIMSIIKEKTSFRGVCECKHTPFRPFKNDHAFLMRPLTPFPGDAEAQGHGGHDDSDDDAHIGAAAAQHGMPPPHSPVQQQWAPPAGYFDPYFASMQESLSSQIAGLTSQMQNQMDLNFQNMQQQMFQPMMAQMQGVQENLYSDIAALDARFEDLPSSEQFEQLEHRQQDLEQRFDTFSTAFTGFSDHFYSVFPAPVPPPEFYPHQPFYPPPPPPPPMD